ncbi:MAG: outer membrane protein assembly factor BamD [Bacteroidota bacterium]|nr:outer membrane protein assembly factor BamD [Bacteroidota bacterium]
MFRIFIIVFLSSILLSCNEYQKLLNSTDNDTDKYNAAEKYYNDGEFRRANALIEQLIPSYRGKPQGERLVFFFADSYFQTKLYYSAAIQFENFIKSYPNSQRIQEAYFMEAKSYYMLSPLYTLDQDDTYTGIDKLQVFINRFPNSEYVSEALELMNDLQNKLEEKDFEISKQYYTIRDYTSAIKALDNFVADNPGTIFREEALYYKWLSQFEIAINSIESRIVDRVTELERSLDNFLRNYPDTIFIEDLSEKINIAKQLL